MFETTDQDITDIMQMLSKTLHFETIPTNLSMSRSPAVQTM